MPARSTRITLLNRTSYTLTLVNSNLAHGDWTPGGWVPVPSILPGAQPGWQSESSGDIPVFGSVGTGTEGTVTYSIDGTGQNLFIHWDNPFVGLNSYHQTVGPGFGISFSGGKGNNCEAIYTLQFDAPVFVPGFLPSRNGFPFSNHWPDETITYLELPPFTWWGNGIAIGNAANGLCGGMAFAAQDYFAAGQWPAQVQPSGAGTPVFDYIARRLLDSFNSPINGSCSPAVCGGYNILANVVDFETQMDPIYPDSDNYITDGTVGDGRAWIMAHEAWPQLQASIDGGNPCPLGLVQVKSLLPTDLGQNHQVLVYGYQLKQQVLTLHVYDPNHPLDDGVAFTVDISDTGEPLHVERSRDDNLPIYSFFILRYSNIPSVGGFDRASSSGAVAVSRSPIQIDVFWTGRDGSVNSAWWNAGTNNAQWNKPFALAAPGFADLGPIATASRSATSLDVFWVSRDGAVWSNWRNEAANGADWNKPFEIAPANSADTGAVAAVATPNHLDVFWIGRDGSVQSSWWDSGANNAQWNKPFQIAPACFAEAGAIAAVRRTPNHLDVLWIGRDGSVSSNWLDAQANGGKWNQPFEIASASFADTGAISTVARSAQHLDVFWIGRDGSVQSSWWDSGANNAQWNKPFQIAPACFAEAGAIAAVGRNANHLDVFWIGRDGAVWSVWWDAAVNSGRWNAPFQIARAGIAAPGLISAVARTPDVLDIFWIGLDGALWSNWWNASANKSNWNEPFVLAPELSASPNIKLNFRLGGPAVGRAANHLDVFWSGPDGSVRSNWWDLAANKGLWNLPFNVASPSNAHPGGWVIGTGRQALHLDSFWTAPDGSIRSNWWDQGANNGFWNGAFVISPAGSAPPGAPIAVSSRNANHIDLFWIGPDGSLRTCWWDIAANNRNWNAAFNIAPPGQAVPGSQVRAIARTPLHIDVFWAGADGSVRSVWWDQLANKSLWNAPFNISAPGTAVAGTQLACASRNALRADVFWTATDGSVHWAWWELGVDNGDWHLAVVAEAGSAHPGSAIASSVREPFHLDLFWIGPDGSIRSSWWEMFAKNVGFVPSFNIAGVGSASLQSFVEAVARQAAHLDIFWVAPNGSVMTNWWDKATSNGEWNAPFSIAPPGSAVG